MQHLRHLPLTILFLLICFVATSQTPVQKHGRLHVSGIHLQDQHGKNLILKGVSFGWHNFWPRFYNPDAVKWLTKDWKISVVRAAIGVEPHNGYLEDTGFAYHAADSVILGAIDAGIYVIIDWHAHDIHLEQARQFFIRMALRYHNFPNIIYELYNEPDYESWQDVKSYSESLIKTIRKIDRDNIILVGNPHWDQDIMEVARNPIKEQSNIMYTVHYYAATHKQWLRDRCDSALSLNIPIFISESASMEASGDGKTDLVEYSKWLEWSKKNQLSWVVWSISDKDESCSMLNKNAASRGNWSDKFLKYTGILTKLKLK